MEQTDLEALSGKLDRLIARCEHLEAENQSLQELHEELHRERAQLMQKNDLARNKLEAMIGRLRALEPGSRILAEREVEVLQRLGRLEEARRVADELARTEEEG